MKTDSVRYLTRGKGKLHITVTDESGRPVRAHLGLSIFDRAYSNDRNSENMLSYCFLSTELKGHIHNPAYYFDEAHKDRLASLDLLLLTQGWRRYVWEKVDPEATTVSSLLSDEIKGVQLVGRPKKQKELGTGEQLLQVSGANGENCFIIIDSLGKFVLSTDQMLSLRGGYVYLKPMLNKDDYKPSLVLDSSFDRADSLRLSLPSYFSYMAPSQIHSELSFDDPVVSRDSSILLSEVTVTGKKRRVFRDKMMGGLDSLAQMDLNSVYVCVSCGLLLNYRIDYQGHHAVGVCPAKGRKQPVNGKSYPIAKYKHYPSSGGPTPFSVIDRREVVNTSFVGVIEGTDGIGNLGTSQCEFKVLKP